MSDNELYRVAQFGTLFVWQRVHYRRLRLPKYIVGEDTRGRMLAEFRTFRSAVAWINEDVRSEYPANKPLTGG